MTTDLTRGPVWTAAPLPVTDPRSAALLRGYYVELIERYYGRPTDEEELAAVLAEEPSDDLARPTGEFVVARRAGGPPAACVGVRVLDAGTAELTRMYVSPAARRQGVARLLVATAEDIARDTFGAVRMRLDTRKDLVEARALYTALGYTEIEAYNDSPYADHWFDKPLR